MMESAKVSLVRSASPSPTDLSLCNSKRKSSISSNHNNNNNSKRFRLSEATESAAAAAAAEAEEASRVLKATTSSSSAAGSPTDNQHAKLLGMPDQNTASMLAAMAFVTRARSSFMIGDILNSSRWDPSQHHGHPLLGPYHQATHPAAAAALMAATAASAGHHPQHQHGLNLHHHHHLLQHHPSMMEGVHRDHHRRDTSKSEEESEVDVESNASYNSQTSREFLIKSRNCFVLFCIYL